MKNYYEILGIEKNASKEDVKRAFRKLHFTFFVQGFTFLIF